MKRSCSAWMVAAFISVFLSHALPMTAQLRAPIDVSALGPQVGDRVPDFRLPDQTGTMQTLESIMGEKGAMLVFHRSADW